ncbi:uncharacterized protein [Rutidosis leptorrhynchoides]|uniref:uncharacterized protein n=1 Tax=Rutidosis leptorrhynchoides TaxID=125765 RepID=UPI003A99C324
MFNTNPSDGPVVIEARAANCLVRNIYTDTGAGANIMYEHCFIQLPKDVQERIKETYVPLASFTSESSWSEGSILLEVTLGKPPLRRTSNIEFLVVKANSQYNIILGRTALMTFGAVTSTVHGMMKFPTPGGVATLYAERQKSIECSQEQHISDLLIRRLKIKLGETWRLMLMTSS